VKDRSRVRHRSGPSMGLVGSGRIGSGWATNNYSSWVGRVGLVGSNWVGLVGSNWIIWLGHKFFVLGGSNLVGSNWIGLGHKILRLGRDGLSRFQYQKYLINIQFTREKPILRRVLFIMIRSCNIANYYRLIIYSNIKDVFFELSDVGLS